MSNECPICYDDAVDIIAFDSSCTHGACASCAARLHRCPFCRAPFRTAGGYPSIAQPPSDTSRIAPIQMTNSTRAVLHSELIFNNVAPSDYAEQSALQPFGGTVIPLLDRATPYTMADIASGTYLRPLIPRARETMFVTVTVRVRENAPPLWHLLRYLFSFHTTTMAVCSVFGKRYAEVRQYSYNPYTERGRETTASRRNRELVSTEDGEFDPLRMVEHNMVRPHFVPYGEHAATKHLEVKFTVRGESLAMWAHTMREIVLPGRSELEETTWLRKLEEAKLVKTRRRWKWTGSIS